MKLRPTLALLLAGVVASALVLVAMPSSASASEPDSRELPLINAGSNKCLQPTEPGGHVEWDGVPITQSTCQPTALHNWQFVSVGYVTINGGEPPWWCVPLPTVPCDPIVRRGYHIRNQLTGKCLDARDGATTDWSVVQQWTCGNLNARSMIWWVEDGDFPSQRTIVNFNSELCLDVAWGSGDDGAQIQQFHCTDNNLAQNFYQQIF